MVKVVIMNNFPYNEEQYVVSIDGKTYVTDSHDSCIHSIEEGVKFTLDCLGLEYDIMSINRKDCVEGEDDDWEKAEQEDLNEKTNEELLELIDIALKRIS